MDVELTEEQHQIRDTLRELVRREVAPAARDWDAAAAIPASVLRELAELGMFGMEVPEELGGAALDPVGSAIALEEVARGDGSLALTLATHNHLAVAHVRFAGSEAQQAELLPPLARGEQLASWAMEERGHADDRRAVETRAERHGEDWTLRGRKTEVVQGGRADRYVVVARSVEDGGPRAFVVDADAPGLRVEHRSGTMGMRGAAPIDLRLDGVELPDARRLSATARTEDDLEGVLDGARIAVASIAVGLAAGSLDAAATYALQRHQFGRPIGEFQAIQDRLADMRVAVESSRLMVWRAAAARAAGRGAGGEARMARVLAADTAWRVCDHALQIHGGVGYTREFPVERHWRDVPMTSHHPRGGPVERAEIASEALRRLRL